MDDKEINFPTFKERPEKVDVDMDILNDTIEYIRPAVQADGGDIKLSSVKDGVVNIEMLGACQGCPLSIATLKTKIPPYSFGSFISSYSPSPDRIFSLPSLSN